LPETSTDFEVVTVGLASPEAIRSWSYGEVKKPETINYRTYRPEPDGLFCERIFGPTKDWECRCGKYKKVKFKGIICDRCGVEVTRRKVRRERMGHIDLASPVCHSWYLKGVPSPIGLLLDVSATILKEVAYFGSYIVIEVDRETIEANRELIREAVEEEKQEIRETCDAAISHLQQHYENIQKRAAGEEVGQPEEEADTDFLSLSFTHESLPEQMNPRELGQRIQQEQKLAAQRIEELEETLQMLFEIVPKQPLSEVDYRQLRGIETICGKRLGKEFENLFHAGLGAEAVRDLLASIDLDELAHDLRKEVQERAGARRARAVKRLKIVEAFRNSKNRPEWMVLEVVPVLPPELRPMVQLDGGRFATSDLNDLYRRVINRNNRLRRIIEINAPESIVNHERRLLQEAVDALIDNNRRRRPVTGSNRRQLKSLSDQLKGKEGRFRKNLLGKRVDYSGRSVIVVGPELKLHQCGLPREMALELFKPFVMNRLVDAGHTTNIKTAKRMIDRMEPQVWDALDEVIEGHPVLLNRAPTLHRLGIQAFEPVLVDGKAIQLHPLACQAFNADFDGDQMAVHVPLSAYAQAEARLLMIASRNLFKPGDGSPVSQPLYDMVLGVYYLTQQSPEVTGTGRVFESAEAVITAYEHRKIDLHANITARLPMMEVEAVDDGNNELEIDADLEGQLKHVLAVAISDEHPARERTIEVTVTDKIVHEVADRGEVSRSLLQADKEEWIRRTADQIVARACLEGRCPVGSSFRLALHRVLTETTVGRVVFNYYLPRDLPFVNHALTKDELAELILVCYKRYGEARTAQLLDDIKDIGLRFATRAGVSICMADTDVPTLRDEIVERTESDVRRINKQAREGVIAEDEREQQVLQKWTQAREYVVDEILNNIGSFNSIWMMVDSGARANRSHISQIAGMRGLMSDPFGRLIEDLPVRSNFHEGLDPLEYFVSTHGARKGLADTALRTADAGYLTRRLVDVAQDVIITGIDCGTRDGVEMTTLYINDLQCPECGHLDQYRDGQCHNCGAELSPSEEDEIIRSLRDRIVGRTAAEEIINPDTDELIVEAGEEINERIARLIDEAGIRSVKVRSPLTCELQDGVCAKCYGRDSGRRKPVEIGTAVGIIAAQSIGEPGTQLTMQTFHTGGVAAEYITGVADVKKRKQQALQSLSEDIDQGRVSLEVVGGGARARSKAIREMLKVLESSVHGLLRVVELFEARTPKGQAITADLDGVVEEIETKGLRAVVMRSEQSLDDVDTIRGEQLAETITDAGGEVIAHKGQKLLKNVRIRLRDAGVETVPIRLSYLVPHRGRLYVREGSEVRAGDQLTAGPVDPETILAEKGIRGVQDYLLREIQVVYHAQGVMIDDKHIEVIIRQMLKKRKILDHGDTRFLPGEVVDKFAFAQENRRVEDLGGEPATAEPLLLGITQASLATESFLSAASFQRTTRVLTEAACEEKRDPLKGLKENVIIGRLIPAGSGMRRHRDREIDFTEEVADVLSVVGEVPSGKKDAMQQLLADIEAARGENLAQALSDEQQDSEMPKSEGKENSEE